MKRITILICSLLALMLSLQSMKAGDDIMTKEDGMIIIDTTELGKDIEGYNGPTPLKRYLWLW